MEYVGIFLLLWIIVGLLVALVVTILGKTNSRGDKPSIPVWRPEKRIQVRRARDRGVAVPWHQVNRRHEGGRRHTDRPRKLP
jgi:hypothetical protein